jgi:streptogramin lyase
LEAWSSLFSIHTGERMKIEKHDPSIFALIVICISLLMAGCGGGGSSEPATQPVTPSSPTLVSIAVTPTNLGIALGFPHGWKENYTAIGTFSDNSTQDLTTSVTWSSSNASVATVSNVTGSEGNVFPVSAGTTTISATSGSISGSTNLTIQTNYATFPLDSYPLGIAIDASGNAWVTNNSGTVIKLSPSGAVLGTFPTGSVYSGGIAIDASGNVWVTSNNGVPMPGDLVKNILTKFSPNGTVLGTWERGGAGIAIDASGNVWITESGAVTKLSPSGVVLGTFPAAPASGAIAIDASGNVWVTSTVLIVQTGGFPSLAYEYPVTKLSPSGAVLGTFTILTTTYPGSLGSIAIDASGNVWVIFARSCCSGSVIKLSSNGEVLGTFDAGYYPAGIAIDASGNVWITSGGSDDLTTEFNSSGEVLGTFIVGIPTGGNAIDASGNVWLTSYYSVNVLNHATTGPQFWPYSGPVWP